MHSTPNSIQIQYCKNDEMYSQIHKALRNFVENAKVTKEFVSPSSKSLRCDEQCLILQKVEELLELLKDMRIKSYSDSENLHDYLEDSTRSDSSNHDCIDMSLTLENLQLNDTSDHDTTHLSDMELTCMDSTFFKTPTATVKSILKSAQTQRSESGRRRVRFEDEMEETLAEIIENKENLNWGTNLVEACGLKEDEKTGLTSSTCEVRSRRPISIGKTVKTLTILRRKHKPRKSWASYRGESADLKALRDIKTLVEIEKEELQKEESDVNGYCNDDRVIPKCDAESIKTLVLSPAESSLRLSLLPGDLSDLDIPGFLLTCY